MRLDRLGEKSVPKPMIGGSWLDVQDDIDVKPRFAEFFDMQFFFGADGYGGAKRSGRRKALCFSDRDSALP